MCQEMIHPVAQNFSNVMKKLLCCGIKPSKSLNIFASNNMFMPLVNDKF